VVTLFYYIRLTGGSTDAAGVRFGLTVRDTFVQLELKLQTDREVEVVAVVVVVAMTTAFPFPVRGGGGVTS